MNILRSKYVDVVVLVDPDGVAHLDIGRYANGLIEARDRYLEMAHFMKNHNWHVDTERAVLADVSGAFFETVADIDTEIIDLREHFK